MLVPVPLEARAPDIDAIGFSLGYALIVGTRKLYMPDGPEIQLSLEGPWRTASEDLQINQLSITFIDTSLGGTGYLWRIATELHLVAMKTIEHLHHSKCETACYRCLKVYDNQRHHDKLCWPVIMPHLETLSETPPVARPLETGDIEQPAPWLDAYAAGVGSPLELAFWRLFEKHGFTPEKQVPISPEDGRPPISVADFAVPERRLAIYVDGGAFHVGANLRRDRYIRDQLRNGEPPWRVVELRAADLQQGAALIKRLQNAE